MVLRTLQGSFQIKNPIQNAQSFWNYKKVTKTYVWIYQGVEGFQGSKGTTKKLLHETKTYTR